MYAPLSPERRPRKAFGCLTLHSRRNPPPQKTLLPSSLPASGSTIRPITPKSRFLHGPRSTGCYYRSVQNRGSRSRSPRPPPIRSWSPPSQRHQRRHRTGRLHRHAPVAARTRTCPTGSFPSGPATAPRPDRRRRRQRTSTAGKPGDRVSYPGNHASHELLTIGHERGRLWKLPDNLDVRERPSLALHRSLRPGRRRSAPASRSAARRRCWASASSASSPCVACSRPARFPVVGIDAVPMRRDAAHGRRAPTHVIDPTARRRDSSS